MDLSWSKSRPVSTSSVTSSPGWNFVQWSAIPPLWISAFSRAVQWACATSCCECRLSDASPITPAKTGSSSNLEGHRVHSHEDVEKIRRIVENKLAPLGRKVYSIVNYVNYDIFP